MVLVSATLPHDVLEMTSKFMTDPVRVLVKRDELTLEVRFQGLVVKQCSFMSPAMHMSSLGPCADEVAVSHQS